MSNNEIQFEGELRDVLEESADDGGIAIASISTFEENMVLTSSRGLVVQMEDGSEFQVTIVQSA